MKDIFEPVIRKLTQEISEKWPVISADLKKPQARTASAAGAAAGATVGASVGGSLGIAAGPLGVIAGTAPGALIGGIIGFFAGDKIGAHFKDEDD